MHWIRLAVLGIVVAVLGSRGGAAAQAGIPVEYSSGSEAGIQAGSEGVIQPDADRGLVFHAGSEAFSIPFDGVSRAEYREVNRFRLGVLPAIAVGLVKARAKRHLLVLTWKDAGGSAQAAVFETTKDNVRTLLAILRAHASGKCPRAGGCIADLPY